MTSLSIKRVGLLAVCLVFIAATGIPSLAANDEDGPYGSVTFGPSRKLPNGGRPAHKVPFPAITDWSTLRITLERGMCFGTCPAYRVEIDGDGTVDFIGKEHVVIKGHHVAHISTQAVHQLYDAFAKANFFWTLDNYQASITDFPAYRVTLSFDNHTKTVGDYVGLAVGMPKAIVELENAIDSAADTVKWVKGSDETFPSLVAEHWDFQATDDDHLRLIAGAAEKGDVGLVRKLLAAGVSAKSKFGCKGLEGAARTARADMVDALASAGAPVHWDAAKGHEYDTCDALRAAAMSGIPRIVRAVLDLHPDVNWQDEQGGTALTRAAENAEKREGRTDQDYGAVARLLIYAGADVNHRTLRRGESALMKAHQDAGIVRVLLQAGAKDVNAPDGLGQTPLMNSYSPDVTQALLEGGADPWMVDKEGKTALDIAKKDDWRKTAPVLQQWMAAHPKPH